MTSPPIKATALAVRSTTRRLHRAGMEEEEILSLMDDLVLPRGVRPRWVAERELAELRAAGVPRGLPLLERVRRTLKEDRMGRT